MRTTFTIADDVLTAARAIAQQTNQSLGTVISDLARRSLRLPMDAGERNGVPLLPVSRVGMTVRPEMIAALDVEIP